MTAGGASVTAAARIDDLISKAMAETGLEDFGGDSWREGLERLVSSAESEGRFTGSGQDVFYGSLVRALVTRLRIEGWYARHPEIDDQEVQVELLGVGFPRTGSTALSHMLAEEPTVRSLRMWEETAPCPPPGVSAEDDRARVAAAEMAVSMGEGVAARLRSMLPQSATGPMEDHDLMALEFKAQHFLVAAHIPSYAEWFLGCDMEPTYRYERRVFKLLQWKCPPTRWWLKSPTHTLFLDAYEKVFPEARFWMTHRDVSKVLPSVTDLYYTMLQGGNEGIDAGEVGRLNMEQWGLALDRCLAFRDAGREDRFYDIGFSAFQADPIAEIRGLYEWLGRDLTPETERHMGAWREDNPLDKFGRHEYSAEEFGIDEVALAARFGTYRARFWPLLR
jgi:Sulfotransferase family